MRKRWALSRRRRIVFYLSVGISCPSLVFGWHVLISLEVLKQARAFDFGCPESPVEFVCSIEPVADLVTVRPAAVEVSAYDNLAAIEEPDAGWRPAAIEESGALVAQRVSLMARRMQSDVPVLEKLLNDFAKSKLDAYAVVLPYRVKIGAGRSASAKQPGRDAADAE